MRKQHMHRTTVCDPRGGAVSKAMTLAAMDRCVQLAGPGVLLGYLMASVETFYWEDLLSVQLRTQAEPEALVHTWPDLFVTSSYAVAAAANPAAHALLSELPTGERYRRGDGHQGPRHPDLITRRLDRSQLHDLSYVLLAFSLFEKR